MDSKAIGTDIKAFMGRYVRSVAHLELILLMSRNVRKEWTASELSVEMRTNPSYAESQLNDLSAAGLVYSTNQQDHYCFTADKEALELCDRLRSLYNSRRSTIINLIYSKPLEKILDLADGFVFKKD